MNGGLNAPFRVCRGVRHGCSLLGLLYSLSIEPMLCKIRANIEGLILTDFNKRHFLSANADYVNVPIQNQEEIKKLERIVEDSGTMSAVCSEVSAF